MTIRHNIAKGQERHIYTTEYDNGTLTRIIDAKIHTIHMKGKDSLKDLERLTSLDDESFTLMSYLQKDKK